MPPRSWADSTATGRSPTGRFGLLEERLPAAFAHRNSGPPVLRQNSVRRQVIDLAGLIQRQIRVDGQPPAPPASAASPPLRALNAISSLTHMACATTEASTE